MMIRYRIASLLAALAVMLFAVTLTSRGDDAVTASATSKPSDAASATQPDAGGALKFYGTVTAVDPQAKTFVVDNQTYTIVPESHMTKAADDSLATIDDAVVGQPARGTYTKSSDGKLSVTKVRFGRKSGGGKAAGGGKSGGKKNAATTKSQDQ